MFTTTWYVTTTAAGRARDPGTKLKHVLMLAVLQNLEKVIPDQPKQSTPVHLRQKQIFAHKWIQRWEKPYVPGQPYDTEHSGPSQTSKSS